MQQIGVPYKEIDSIENINFADLAVIIVSSSLLTRKEKKVLYDYTGDGGAVITEASGAKSVFNVDLNALI